MFEKLPDCLRRAYDSSLHSVTLRMTDSYNQKLVMLSKAKHLVILPDTTGRNKVKTIHYSP